MAERLKILLSEEATKRYLEIVSGQATAEVNADCEPSAFGIANKVALA